MKTILNLLLVLTSFVLVENGNSQGFVNLDFEDATIVPDPSSPYYPYAVYATNAIPGWVPDGFLGTNEISYNDLSLGAPSVSLFGTNGPYPVIAGAFSIDLYGGSGGLSGGASISQIGLVPSDTRAILFKAQSVLGTLSVALGGQNIPYSPIGTGPNYTLYGGNIPLELAGKMEQLMFKASTGGNNYWEIDDILFSSSPVPEPGALGLFALSGLLLCLRLRKRSAS